MGHLLTWQFWCLSRGGPINLNIHNIDINIGIGIGLILVWLDWYCGFSFLLFPFLLCSVVVPSCDSVAISETWSADNWCDCWSQQTGSRGCSGVILLQSTKIFPSPNKKYISYFYRYKVSASEPVAAWLALYLLGIWSIPNNAVSHTPCPSAPRITVHSLVQ